MEINLDFQKVFLDKSITKQLQKDQCILLSALVIKYNHVGKKQQRIILVTSKYLYNLLPKGAFNDFISTFISGARFKRKISYNNIQAITLSRFGPQFVIHIPKQHDYRFSSNNLKLKIVESICKGYCQFHKRKMPLYYYDDLTLQNYTTTLIDLQKNKRKTHIGQPQYLDPQSMKQNQNSKPESTLIFKNKQSDKVISNFEEFELKKVLGKGAFGKVMLCQRKGTNQYYAVKSMRKQNLIQKQHLQKARTQRKILQIASHPFLVNLEYAFQTKEKIFFVMKFFRGGQMFLHLKKFKRFKQSLAKFYAVQVLLAIQYLHQLGYIYRDLKPQNILFDVDGYIKVSDYGLAKLLKPGQKTNSLVGTPQYVSPQIIINSGHTFTTDWWSFGILIHQMIFGCPPFYNKNRDKMLKDIQLRPLLIDESKVQISPQAKSIISSLLIKNPEQRLGAHGAKQIKNHPWFKGINLKKLINKQIIPEFIPTILNDFDVNNFDQQFTKQDPVNSLMTSDILLLNKFQKQFEGMSFYNQNDLQQ